MVIKCQCNKNGFPSSYTHTEILSHEWEFIFLDRYTYFSNYILFADIDVDKPDKKLIIMYLTSLYHGLREYSPQGGKKRRKLDVSFC